MIKNPPANNAQDSGSIPGLGRSTRQQGMATHSSVLVWEIPWTEETGGLQSMGSQRDECDLGHTCMHACGKSESQDLAPWTTRLRPLSSQGGQTTCPAGSHMLRWVRNWDGSNMPQTYSHLFCHRQYSNAPTTQRPQAPFQQVQGIRGPLGASAWHLLPQLRRGLFRAPSTDSACSHGQGQQLAFTQLQAQPTSLCFTKNPLFF